MLERSDMPLTISVVDDDPRIAKPVMDMIEIFGHQGIYHPDPTVFLSQFSEIKPDALITDFQMPIMDGFSLLRAVNLIDPRLPNCIASGDSSLPNLVAQMETVGLRIDSYLIKPIMPDQLLRVLALFQQYRNERY